MFDTFTNDTRFKFYMIFVTGKRKDDSVASYMSAKRLHIIEPLDPDDFSE